MSGGYSQRTLLNVISIKAFFAVILNWRRQSKVFPHSAYSMLQRPLLVNVTVIKERPLMRYTLTLCRWFLATEKLFLEFHLISKFHMDGYLSVDGLRMQISDGLSDEWT